ncbi:MAG: 4Fe-4S dicluster domain-containing protein [Gemmatimonadota bacterium]|nr:MAG: 4Fe-4S dicluster domain-containing protein [Gemmatimonadota bacterium]
MANSFVFDPNRCTGCHACRLACSIENDLGLERSWRRIDTYNRNHLPNLPLYHLSLACNHCNEPACMYACPALAYSRDTATGALILDEGKCLGCRYCAWACPYDAPVFDQARGIMTKCTFCNHRLLDGLKPACAALCPTGALDFADLPEDRLRQEIAGFPTSALQPRLQIKPLRPERKRPLMTAADVRNPFVPSQEPSGSEISLRSEWSLVGFTTLLAVLVATVTANLKGALAVPPLVFLGAAALKLGLASAHLGRLSRAYRAVLNLRRSWLSREVVAVSSFVGLSCAYLWLAPDSRIVGASAVLAGVAALWCADQVYGVLDGAAPVYQHSASVLWTGLYLSGLLGGTAWLAGLLGFGKMMLYVLRKLRLLDTGKPVRPLISAARLVVGLLLPLLLWSIDREATVALQVFFALLGEAIDRAEFYSELQPRSPRRQMALELDHQLGVRSGRSVEPALSGAD